MSVVQYVCEELENVEISCMVVNGDPWFKGIEVAKVLGYKCPRKALFDHAPLKFKNKLSFLLSQSKVTKTVTNLGCKRFKFAVDIRSRTVQHHTQVKVQTCRSLSKLGM